MHEKDRDYVYLHVPVEEQDRGAYDEGFYYDYCSCCRKKTEHENEVCCECGGDDLG